MADRASGDGTSGTSVEEPPNPPREASRRRAGHGRSLLILLPVVLLSVWIDQGVIKVHWLVATVVIVLAVLAEELVDRLVVTQPELGPALRGLRTALSRYGPGTAALIAGAAVVISGWSLAGWSQTRLSACPPPAELRVMAAPETLGIMRERATEFTDAQAAGERCRPVHVTVFAAPPMRPLSEAFRNGWLDDRADRSPLATVGPRPDLWLASSKSIADHATEEGIGYADKEITPARTASPVVLAISRGVGEPPGDFRENWDNAIEWLLDTGVMVLRPSPESSDAAVIATTALYGPGESKAEQHRREQQVSPSEMPLNDVREMLCGVRERLIGNPGAKVAVIVPAHALDPYGRGEPLGGSCTRRLTSAETEVQRLDLIRPRGAPLLDYTIVRVTWNDERDAGRERLAAGLRDWLVRRGLGRSFEPPGANPVDVTELAEARQLISTTRQPRTLLFAVDRSGSMKAPVSGGTAIGRARDMTQEALNWLGATDSAGLWTFPGDPDARAPQTLVPPGPSADVLDPMRVAASGTATDADGATTPLHHVIVEGAQALREQPGEGSLVVLTDGDNDAGGHAREDREALHEELSETGGPDIYLVVVGERGCDRELLAMLEDSPRARCLDFGATGGPRQVVGELFAHIWRD